MKKTINFFLGINTLIILIAFGACAESNKNLRTDTRHSGEVTILADECFSNLIDEEIEVFHALNIEAQVNVEYTNEVDAMQRLMNDSDSIYLVITSRNFKEKERKLAAARNHTVEAIPIAYDGLSLIVNKENPDTAICVNDVKRILSGEVTRWNQIYKNSKLGEFDIVFDNPKSSTVQFVVDSLLNGKEIKAPSAAALKTSMEVIKYVKETPNAIGVIGSNWLCTDTTNLKFREDIQVMAVCRGDELDEKYAYQPYQAWIQLDKYPLYRKVYALVYDTRAGLPTGFAHFLESPRGQRIVLKSNLLNYRGDVEVINVNIKRN